MGAKHSKLKIRECSNINNQHSFMSYAQCNLIIDMLLKYYSYEFESDMSASSLLLIHRRSMIIQVDAS